MTFDELRDLVPGTWIEADGIQFIRLADSENSKQGFSNDAANVLSGAFLNPDTGILLHASYLINTAKVIKVEINTIPENRTAKKCGHWWSTKMKQSFQAIRYYA